MTATTNVIVDPRANAPCFATLTSWSNDRQNA